MNEAWRDIATVLEPVREIGRGAPLERNNLFDVRTSSNLEFVEGFAFENSVRASEFLDEKTVRDDGVPTASGFPCAPMGLCSVRGVTDEKKPVPTPTVRDSRSNVEETGITKPIQLHSHG